MCLSSSSAEGRCLVSTKIRLRKSRQWSDTCAGSTGLVGWVAILKMAAMASNSAQGGRCVNISTTVQPTLLKHHKLVSSGQSKHVYQFILTFYLITWTFSVSSVPDVSLASVALAADDLGAHPIGCPSHRLDPCSRQTDGLQTPAGAKVAQLHVPHRVPQDVGA